MDNKTKTLLGGLIAAAIAFLGYFGYQVIGPEPGPPIVSLEIRGDTLLKVGETVTLTAIGIDSTGAEREVEADWCIHPEDADVETLPASVQAQVCTAEQLQLLDASLDPAPLEQALAQALLRVRSPAMAIPVP